MFSMRKSSTSGSKYLLASKTLCRFTISGTGEEEEEEEEEAAEEEAKEKASATMRECRGASKS